MPAQTNDRDIPVRKADVDATTAAVTDVATAQADGSQKTKIVNAAGDVVGATGNALDVNIKSGVTLEVNLDAANDDVLVYGYDGAAAKAIKTDAAGELQVDVLSSALPSGAATEATLGTRATAAAQTDGTQKAMVMGIEGANQRQVAVDASARLLVAQPTAAALNVTEASAASILARLDVALSTRALEAGGNLADIKAALTASGAWQLLTDIKAQLDNKTSTLAKESGGNLAALATAADKLADDRKLIPVAFSAAAVADGGEVELTGFTALGHYTLLQFNSTPHTGGGIATHRQRRLYRATGGAVADLCWEEPTDLAVADGIFIPYSQLGNVIKADAAGKIWLRYEVTGGGTITETGDLYFFPLRTA